MKTRQQTPEQLTLRQQYQVRKQMAQGAVSAETIYHALKPGGPRKSLIVSYMSELSRLRSDCAAEGPLQAAALELKLAEQDLFMEIRQFLDSIDPGSNPTVIRALGQCDESLQEASKRLNDPDAKAARDDLLAMLEFLTEDIPRLGGPTVDVKEIRERIDEVLPEVPDLEVDVES